MVRKSNVILAAVTWFSLVVASMLMTSAIAASPEEIEAECRAKIEQQNDPDWSEEDKEDIVQLCIAEAERDEPPPPEITNPDGQ